MNLSKNTDVRERVCKSIEGLPVHGQVKVKAMLSGDQMTVLEVQYDAGAGGEPHAHQHESICYVVKGKVRMKVGDEEYILGPGDVCRHPKGVVHIVEGIEPSVTVEIKSPAQDIDKFLGTE